MSRRCVSGILAVRSGFVTATIDNVATIYLMLRGEQRALRGGDERDADMFRLIKGTVDLALASAGRAERVGVVYDVS